MSNRYACVRNIEPRASEEVLLLLPLLTCAVECGVGDVEDGGRGPLRVRNGLEQRGRQLPQLIWAVRLSSMYESDSRTGDDIRGRVILRLTCR